METDKKRLIKTGDRKALTKIDWDKNEQIKR